MRWTRLLAGPALALALLVGLTACGGDDDGDGGVASVDGSRDEDEGGDDSAGADTGRPDDSEFQDAMLEYAQCMRDHGIDMPDPELDESGGGGVITRGPVGEGEPGEMDEEMQAAEEACGPILEEAAPDMELTPEEQAEMQDQMLEVAECMRARGHDMPDPEVDSSGRVRVEANAGEGGPPDQGSPQDQEQFEQDMEDCHEQAGVRGPDSAEDGEESDDEEGGDS